MNFKLANCASKGSALPGPQSIDRLILTGFYPRIYDQRLNPTQALGDYYETYVERDVRRLATIRDIGLFQKFIRLCAGIIGQIVNLQSLASDTGISHTTAHTWMNSRSRLYYFFTEAMVSQYLQASHQISQDLFL